MWHFYIKVSENTLNVVRNTAELLKVIRSPAWRTFTHLLSHSTAWKVFICNENVASGLRRILISKCYSRHTCQGCPTPHIVLYRTAPAVKCCINAAKHRNQNHRIHSLCFGRVAQPLPKLALLFFELSKSILSRSQSGKRSHGHVIRHSLLFFTHKHIHSPGCITQYFVAESLLTVTAG